MFEEVLRYKVPGVTLPYWDSTLDSNMYSANGHPQDSVLWTGGFYGNGNGFVRDGPFAWQTPYGPLNRNHASGGRLITTQDVNTLFTIQSGGQVAAFLEDIHNSVHNWVGGQMSNIRISPVDPIFFMHHAYIDYLWWQWQMRVGAPRAFEYPPGGSGDHSPNAPLLNIYLGPRYTNADGYSARWANMVSYERSPSCSAGTCNSRFLQCSPGGCASRDMRRPQNARPQQQQFGRKRRSADIPLHVYPDLHKAFNIKPTSKSRDSTTDISPTKSEPVNDNTCFGFSVQNDFRINCKADYNLWAFLPIKVIHLRTTGKVYNSYLVKKGKPDYSCDLYSSANSSSSKINSYIKPQSPSCYKYCPQDESGIFRASIKSFGINYVGYFTDYVILDNRQPIDAKISYIGFRKPTQKASRVFLTVFDHCGRICRPKCLVPGSNPPIYRSCSGLLNINWRSPKFYGNTYQKAVLNYWKFNIESSCPTQREKNVFIVFYCDYKRDWWPWRGSKVRNGSWKYTFYHDHHYQHHVKY
ncbi:hypothetical protein FSP39_004333 [Pinctada imbricata]|uniref:Tyrosinase copper-binding domain-containing protein n=1 Tax=Pinctada imbricata TaxID=66713 RepID=A0AA88YB05_PINIB|nr:hypothetical protein FSP39_004333 [Pinctada imbricata]